jgi:hypothetical protein
MPSINSLFLLWLSTVRLVGKVIFITAVSQEQQNPNINPSPRFFFKNWYKNKVAELTAGLVINPKEYNESNHRKDS